MRYVGAVFGENWLSRFKNRSEIRQLRLNRHRAVVPA
jgi:hypothetical protein